MGRAIGLYYIYLVLAMILVQNCMFKAVGCNRSSPLSYYWLCVNVIMFYVFIAYGLSLWGAYICWEMEEEEEETQEAVKKYMENMKQNDQKLYML